MVKVNLAKEEEGEDTPKIIIITTSKIMVTIVIKIIIIIIMANIQWEDIPKIIIIIIIIMVIVTITEAREGEEVLVEALKGHDSHQMTLQKDYHLVLLYGKV